MTLQTTPGTDSTRILLASLAAFVVAALILATLVLPAEFNRDPLGTGQLLGIKGLSNAAPQIISQEEKPYREDAVSFQLLPFESVEYKYELEQGHAMLYNWHATNMVTVEFHGEPDDGPEGYAESYSKGKFDQDNGAFVAPFSGIHGWFWENRGTDTVTVKLRTAGFYGARLEFRNGFVNKKP